MFDHITYAIFALKGDTPLDAQNSSDAIAPHRESSFAIWLRETYERRAFRSETTLWCISGIALVIAYTFQFQLVRDESVFRSILTSLINILPIILVGVSVRLLVRRYLLRRPIVEQVAIHIVMAIVFAHLWYLLILLLAGFSLDWMTSGINLSPFYAAATRWQLLQGIVVYAAMQGLIYGRWLQERLDETQMALQVALERAPDRKPTEPDAVFVKVDGEFKKIDLEDLIHLEADGDQVQLHSRLGSFACSKPLSGYALQLEDSGYIRVHRSHLVRVKEIVSAEPTGDGRLSIHLSNGTSIIASRTGTRAFKNHTR